MSIDQRVGTSIGTQAGLAAKLGDLDRRLRSVEAAGTRIAPNAISGVQVNQGAIDTPHLAAGSIDASVIDATSIRTAVLTAGSINTPMIVIGGLDATTAISGGTIDTVHLAADSVETAQLAANSVSADKLQTNLAMANKVLANLVNASDITTTGLSAVTANMGTLTAGRIIVGSAGAAKTAIGTAISTSTGNKDGIVGTNSSNQITFWMDPNTGNLQLKGQVLAGSTGLGNLDGNVYNTTSPLFVTNPAGGYALVVDAINTREIAASAVTADEIAGLTITGAKIAAGTLTADKLNVGIGGANLLAHLNPSFEADWTNSATTLPTGYSKYGSNSASRATGAVKYGSYSVVINYQNDLRLISVTTNGNSTDVVAPNEYVTMSVWVYIPSSWNGGQITLGDDGTNPGFTFYRGTNADMAKRDQWQRIWITYQNDATANTFLSMFVRAASAPSAGQVVYFDGFQFEHGNILTAFTGMGPGQFVGTQITPGAVSTLHLAASSITADKLNFRMGGRNLLKNSQFTHWTEFPGVLPDFWQQYDNGGATGTWSQVTNGFSTDVHSWRFVMGSQPTTQKGFKTRLPLPHRPNVEYVISCWWKGNVLPYAAANFFTSQTPIERPPVSTTVWQRYSWRVSWSASDAVYIGTDYTAASSIDVQIARVQLEEGQYPTDWMQYVDPTVLDGSTITAATIRSAATGPRTELTSSGLLMVADTTLNDQSAIDWYTTTSFKFATIETFAAPGDAGWMEIWAKNAGPDSFPNKGTVYVSAKNNAGATRAWLQVEYQAGQIEYSTLGTVNSGLMASRDVTSGYGNVGATAGAYSKRILGSDGKSDFVYKPVARAWQPTYAGPGSSVGGGGTFASGTWTSTGRPTLLIASCGIRPGGPGQFAGLSIFVDGNEIGSTVNYYDVYTHMVQTAFAFYTPTAGTRTWNLRTNNAGNTDVNDRWTIGVIEFDGQF